MVVISSFVSSFAYLMLNLNFKTLKYNCVPFLKMKIAEKINEKRTEIETQFSDAGGSFQAKEIDPKVVEMYQGVGQILAKYRSGKVPKAFKVVAQFR